LQVVFRGSVYYIESVRADTRGVRRAEFPGTHQNNKKHFLQEKAVEATKQKEEKREKPKPEEHDASK
jgi:hypothetical protein